MRSDAVGLFWQDVAKVKPPKKEIIKREPPFRFWEMPDYLPRLEIARNFKPNLFTDMELWQAAQNKEELLFDTEVYPNCVLFAFKSVQSGKVVLFEYSEDPFEYELNTAKLEWVLHNFCIINFNGRKYDFPMVALALNGHDPEVLWTATEMIIVQKQQPKDVLRQFKTKRLQLHPNSAGKPWINQIDLIELTALGPGLKVCAGRLHAKRMQDLPFKPGSWLSEDQKCITRWYVVNDLDNTGLLYENLKPIIQIREEEGKHFGGLDLRSHSDAQMAEAIITSEIKRVTGQSFVSHTMLPAGTNYRYQTPSFIKYESALMQSVLGIVQNAVFWVDHISGAIVMPKELEKLVIKMGNSSYKLGIGGLHSQEKSIAHIADENYFIADTDATSYYPKLILNAGITPENLGHQFLIVYNDLVEQRVRAKHEGKVAIAEVLKIVVNGTFGKLGSVWSIMYAPNLMIQVTITGQLSILMLAERFELNGIEVTSVNTDGIVVKCLRTKEALFKQIVAQWQKDTGFITEEVRYKATYSRDINNYIAVYETPQKGKLFKTKGAYGKTAPKKNAVNEICIDAIKALIRDGTPIDVTIRNCRDLTRFTTMRHVNGGAVKIWDEETPGSNEYLGKVIRWYYATNVKGEIIYAKTGNKVPRSEGAMPCMDLPDEFPADVDYDWYENETRSILDKIGYTAAHT